jgi:hypothetical protein
MKKPPGRPRVDAEDETVPTSTRLAARQYDALWERAQASRVTVAEQLRRDVAAATKRIQK